MLKLVDKMIYLHEGETVYFGRPFKTHDFLNRVLNTNLRTESNPICTLSNLFNQRIERKGELQDYQQNKRLVVAESLSSFNKKYFLDELKTAKELPNPNKKFRENFFKCFFILAKRIILFTFRDRFALLYYIIMIIVLGGFGCILFQKLDGEYISTGGSAQKDLEANVKEINNRVGSVVYLICFNYFLVMSNTSYKMVRENKIIYKELNAGLYRFPNYFFPKNVIDFVFLLVPVLILIYPVSCSTA